MYLPARTAFSPTAIMVSLWPQGRCWVFGARGGVQFWNGIWGTEAGSTPWAEPLAWVWDELKKHCKLYTLEKYFVRHTCAQTAKRLDYPRCFIGGGEGGC